MTPHTYITHAPTHHEARRRYAITLALLAIEDLTTRNLVDGFMPIRRQDCLKAVDAARVAGVERPTLEEIETQLVELMREWTEHAA
jgi:hypothetical protein